MPNGHVSLQQQKIRDRGWVEEAYDKRFEAKRWESTGNMRLATLGKQQYVLHSRRRREKRKSRATVITLVRYNQLK
jgi:hypothetical protein